MEQPPFAVSVRDSIHHDEHQHSLQDTHTSGVQDHEASDENGGALNALWRFEATYHFLLNNNIGSTHAAFVDDLYDALDHAKVSLEQQSAHVLAVLHDKDVRIQELEKELVEATTPVEKRHVGVQVAIQSLKKQTKDQAAQCEAQDCEVKSLRRRVDEQDEQIEVLLDELERIQRVLTDKKTADDQHRGESAAHGNVNAQDAAGGICTASPCTQTEEEATEKPIFNSEGALARIAALQMQLEMAERRNAELIKAERERRMDAERKDEATSLDTVERQLSDAIRLIETSTTPQCRVAPQGNGGEKATCLDLEHKLQLALVEREQLLDQVLALRAEMCQPGRGSVSSVPQRTKGECSQITCHHALSHALQLVQAQKMPAKQVVEMAKLLKKEIRRALRDRGDDGDVAAVVAHVTREWMQWEASHVKEVETLQRRHQGGQQLLVCRSVRLMDEVHRLSQLNIDLQADLKASKSMVRTREIATVSIVDTNHRKVVLEQSIQGLREQLDIAHRAIQALAAGGDGGHVRAVRFADPVSSPSDQLAITRVLNASDWKRHVKELSEELVAIKAQRFNRLQPAKASAHAVTEYFRLEREALRLRNRLAERDQQIQQLEIHREQLEQGLNGHQIEMDKRHLMEALQECRRHDAEDDNSEQDVEQRCVERLHLRHLQTQNSELRSELMKGRSRVVYLERELSKYQDRREEEVVDRVQVLHSLVSKVKEHHNQALQSFSHWQESVRRYDEELTRNESATCTAYGILLEHYEFLSVQLRLLEDSQEDGLAAKQPEHRGEFCDLPTRWRLVEKIQVLQDRCLEVQFCQSCAKHLQPPVPVDRVDKVTCTSSTESCDVSTQTSARVRRRAQQSTGVQVTLELLHSEGSSSRTAALVESALKPMPTQSSTGMAAGDSALQNIQQQLEASLARIAELAGRDHALKRTLEEAQKANKRHAKDREKLVAKVKEVSSSNASLSSRLQEFEREMKDRRQGQTSQKEVADESHNRDELVRIQQQPSLREQENIELVRQLCEAKEKCFQQERLREDAERKAAQLSATLEAQQLSRDAEKNAHLEQYMSKINQSLEAIERDKQRLAVENQQLSQRLSEADAERVKKEAQGRQNCGTETENDTAFDLERLLALPTHQELQTRVILLNKELADERSEFERIRTALEAEKLEKSRLIEAQLQSIEHEKSELGRLMDELKISHECLQQEFNDYQEASADAKAEADKRIEFLTKCVEECSRLVDSAAPGDEIVTARDIYDTIVSACKCVVTGESRVGSSKRKVQKSPSGVRLSESREAKLRSSAGSAVRDEQSTAAVFHSQLQAETWRVRSAKLEASLRAVTLKNKTFEDTVDHLELQMGNLKEEVKDRMSKESALLNKQGQMKVEIANLKAQNTTLTSRLAEACGELKRNQDVSKTSDGEIARLRSALQRKTELLARMKAKADETQQALDNSVKRIVQLENTEKTLATTQLKSKDQTQQLQDLRQQCLVYRDANMELSGQVQTYKEQLSEAQSRVKALRLDSSHLRDQLRALKKAVKKDAAKPTEGTANGVPASESLSPTAVIELLTGQVKTLKRRVLQKQDVIIAHKTKISELDAELVLLRTKLFDVSQAYRQQHQFQQQKEQSIMQGVTHLKEELEASVSRKAEQLDGLRASIFDACEVFVQCELPNDSTAQRPPRSPASSTSSASLSWPEDEDDAPSKRGKVADELLLELRRYADLSPSDLADLHISESQPKSRTIRNSTKKAAQRQQDLYAHQRAQKRGQQLLMNLEHALEVTPQDCRTEICQVLEFLCSKGIEGASVRRY